MTPASRLLGCRLAPILVLLAACAPGAPPPRAPSPPPSAAPPGALPARWVRSSGLTLVGPPLRGGTLALLGGRRALVKPDGAVEAETAPTPEGLRGLALVPTAGGDRLVGYGEHELYVFPEPLGPGSVLVREEAQIDRIAALPDRVVVWASTPALDPVRSPVLLDVTTGTERPVPGWPALEIEDAAFRSVREGVVIFRGLGPAVTSDGITLRPLDFDRGEERRPLDRRGEQILARRGGQVAVVDVAAARLGPFAEEAPPADPTLRWVALTGRDPLAGAAYAGVPGPSRGLGFVAASGLLAEVRLDTGAVVGLVDFPAPTGHEGILLPLGEKRLPCPLARRGGRAVVLCDGDRPRGFSLAEPLGAGALTVLGEARIEGEARVGGMGGVTFRGTCEGAPMEALCALGPGGKSRALTGVPASFWRITPLADGRIAWVETAPDDGSGPEPSARMRFAIAEPGGGTVKLPSFPVPDVTLAPERVYLVEAREGVLRAVVPDGERTRVVTQRVRGGPAAVVSVDGARVTLDGDRVLCDGASPMVSEDGGESWAPLALPRSTEGALLDLSEHGVWFQDLLRIGWGPEQPPVEPRVLAGGPAARIPRWRETGRRLVCRSQGDAGPALPFDPHDAQAFLGGRPPQAPRNDHARYVHDSTPELSVSLDLTGRGDGPPEHWTLRWVAPLESAAATGGRVIPAPTGTSWEANLVGAAFDRGRVLVAIADGGALHLVDVPLRGPVRQARVAADPEHRWMAAVAFGKPTVLDLGGVLHAWPEGSPPAAIGAWEGGQGPELALAPSRRGGVRLLLAQAGWGGTRELAFGGPGARRLPFDGWRPLPLSAGKTPEIPACQGETDGEIVRQQSIGDLPVEIDGRVVDDSSDGRFRIRLDGDAACLAGIVAPIRTSEPGRRGDAIQALIDADLIHGVGRRLASGPGARAEKLACALR